MARMLIVSIDHQAEIVHLAGVDCPERCEAGWSQMRDYTRRPVLNKAIRIQMIGPQRAGIFQACAYIDKQCISDALHYFFFFARLSSSLTSARLSTV